MPRNRDKMPDAQGVHMSDAQCRPMSLMLSMPQCLHIHSLPLILNSSKVYSQRMD